MERKKEQDNSERISERKAFKEKQIKTNKKQAEMSAEMKDAIKKGLHHVLTQHLLT